MSGDVQPRKRREKKKKKDELEESGTPHQHFARAPTPPNNNDDVNIHIYKESSTGGGLCAKFVFFVLLAILATLIGLIITEHRGLTQLDTIETETRFSQLFEGWVDKTPDDHDDHDIHPVEDSHEHEEGHDEHEDAHEDDDEHAEEEEEEEESEQEEEEHASEEDEVVSKEEPEESEQEEEPSAQEAEEEEEEEATEEEEEPTREQSAAEDEEEEEEADDKDIAESEQQDEEADEGDETEKQSEEEEAEPESKQEDEIENEDDDASEHAEDDNGELDVNEPSEEQSVETGAENEEDTAKASTEDEEANEEGTDEPTNTDDEEKKKEELQLDLARRNTIVVPPHVEEVEQTIDMDDEEYSDEEVEEVKLHPKTKQEYQQLRSTYERSLTPESDTEIHDKGYDDEYEDEGDEGEYDDEDEVVDDEEEEDEEELEDEEVENEEEPVSDIDDEDLMKKLEAKYGKLSAKEQDEPEEEYEEEEEEEEENEDNYPWKRVQPNQAYDSDDDRNSWLSGGAQSIYEFENITNSEDYAIKDQLDDAQENIENNAALAVSMFNKIIENYPKSPRALYGKAKSLDNLADLQRSNELLKECIETYLKVLENDKTPLVLFQIAADRCINRMRFIGHYGRAISVHKLLMQRFPEEIKYRNQLAVSYLTINRISEARNLLLETLQKWPNDGFALVHYGFILKVIDNNLEKCIDFLQRGLATKEEGVVDGRFYYHLGDALSRSNRNEEAMKVYEEGVINKIFLSKYQRSLYNIDRLSGRPWWNFEQIPSYKNLFKTLKENYLEIKKEGISVLNSKNYFQNESENLKDVGDWKQFELYARGVKNKENCKRCPFTCNLLQGFQDATGCRRGQIKFSVMHPGTHIWPHCGPTNCRLRVHLGLKVPIKTFIRVAEEIRSWEEGKILIFDDSFEHEVWHNGSEFRLVLIVDIWHPELTSLEKRSLSAI